MSNLVAVKKGLSSPAVKSEFNGYITGNIINFEREVGFAMQRLSGDSYLAQCTPESIQKAVMNVALTGLSLNPVLQQAHLIRRNVSKKNAAGKWVKENICCLDPDYKGLISLMHKFKISKDVFAWVVYENDDFTYDFPTNQVTHHEPWDFLGKEEPGAEKGVYACSVDLDGYRRYAYLPIARVNSIMERSEGYKAHVKDNTKQTIWLGPDRAEMVKKTGIRALWKVVPKNTQEAVQISQAMELSDQALGMDDKQITVDGEAEIVADGSAATSTIAAKAIGKVKEVKKPNPNKYSKDITYEHSLAEGLDGYPLPEKGDRNNGAVASVVSWLAGKGYDAEGMTEVLGELGVGVDHDTFLKKADQNMLAWLLNHYDAKFA